MSDQKTKPAAPAFLDELAPDAVLNATLLRGPVAGVENIRRIVGFVGALYVSQAAGFQGVIGNREFGEYEAVLLNGQSIHGVVVITRGPDRAVTRLDVTHRPLSAVLWVVQQLSEGLGPAFDRAFGD
jgi:hypothetical protein